MTTIMWEPKTILEFCKYDLYPVQRFILKLAYGLPLDNTKRTITFSTSIDKGPYTEREYFLYLQDAGRCNLKEPPTTKCTNLTLAIGRRGGRTTLGGLIAAYETYALLYRGDPHKRYGMPKGIKINVGVVSSDKDAAHQLRHEVDCHLVQPGILAKLEHSRTQSYLQYHTPGSYLDVLSPNHRPALVRTYFKSCLGKGLRGPGHYAVIFDDLAYYSNPLNPNLDRDVWNAITPSTAGFFVKDPESGLPTTPHACESLTVAISTPKGKNGQFSDLYHISSRLENNHVTLQIPTWEINPSIPAKYYQTVKQTMSADTFQQDFGAEFLIA